MTLQYVTKVLTEEQKKSMKKRAEKATTNDRDLYGRKIVKSAAEKSETDRDFYGRKLKNVKPWFYK